MKILIVQDYLRSGGTERQSVFMATSFAKAGHEVTLLTFRPRGVIEFEGEQQPFAFRSLQSFDTGLDWFAPGLLKAAEEASPDVVLCMGRMANCYAGFIQKRLPRAAVVCTMRTGKLLPYLFVRSLRLCRHIIANSHVAKRVLTDDHDIESHKITVIHNSVLRFTDETAARNNALRRYHGANPTTVVILNVAMFRPEKNQRELIEICAKLPGYLDWQLWLGGDGVARKKCERLAHDLGLGSRVKFLGYQSDPTPLYLASDVAVLASQSESLPNFLIEAQLHGVPVVAYDVVGVGECFVPDRSGYLIANKDQTGFITALDKLIRQPAERRRFSQVGREHAQANFVPGRQMQAQLNVFHDLTKQ
ncbi:glycosyltransferase [Oleiharenicola lentus]|uniref:glycosyltransferase n=1 Tax=Oleiharenicola lentus TaxID=2508720 RepID=UPI003F669F4F